MSEKTHPGLRDHWDGIYRERGKEWVSWFEAEPSTLDLVLEVAPDVDAAILDVGGGASRLVDRLLGRGYRRVAVADVSPEAIVATRRRLGVAADRVRWLEGDVRTLEPGFEVDVWHDRAVFHFLTEAEDRDRYRERLLAALRPSGHAIVSTFAADGPTRCSGLDVVRYAPEELVETLGAGLRLVRSRRRVHTTPAGAEQRFTQVVLRRSPA